MFRAKRFGDVARAVWLGALALTLASCTWSYRPIPAEDYVGPPPPVATPLKGAAAPGGAAERPVAEGEAAAPGAAPPEAPAGPIELDAREAVLMAMENNRELAVERLTPSIVRTAVDEERAVFDPVLSGTLGDERVKGDSLSSRGRLYLRDAESIVGLAAMGVLLPTGTSLNLGASTEIADAAGDGSKLVESRVGLTVTQALLRGAGLDVNRARIRQARLDALASQYELRGFAEGLAGRTELTYWDYVMAGRRAEILKKSVEMAEAQRKDTQERVRAGTLAQVELAAAEAEVALRRQDLIDAQSDETKLRLQLLRLLNPPGAHLWERDVRAKGVPVAEPGQVDDVDSHVEVARRMRPDLNQARLGVKRGDLEIVRTRNGLLPRMDLFITLGKSGYADSFSESWKRIDGDAYDIFFGLNASYPAGNHAAEARHRRAVLGQRQALEAVRNLEQLAELDVRSAYVEVMRAKDQVAAATVTRQFDEQKLAAELEKFKINQASAFQVARAQRDLAKSQVAETQAAVDYEKALVELYRLEGSLLERRGIASPGREPVDLAGGE